jgi:DNA (cytosine-5)-methyltransferase 1
MDLRYSVEFDAKARAVLARHWPSVTQHTDVRSFDGTSDRVDVLCGGFPCQDLSIAGRRAGLAGERSGLFYEFARIIGEAQPQWVVIENVPGLLSSQRGGDMGVVVGTLADLGYGVAWRVLDAQYFGVAQRRRRVFIVGCAGDAARAGQVLLEPDGVRRDPPARREAGSTAASGAGRRLVAGSGDIVTSLSASLGSAGPDAAHAQAGWLIPTHDVSPCLQERGGKGVDSDMTQAHVITPTLTAGAGTNCMAPGHGGKDQLIEAAFAPGAGVRRLTPTECERLQGFPDGWTDGQADSSRYRQLGNAVCVPVAEWLGRRIASAMMSVEENAA